MKTALSRSLALGLLLLAGNALAQSAPAQSLPDWDKLTPQQREALIAPVRERWNSDPGDRPRMLEHAQRWKSMTPEQRRQARKGMRRFEGMQPHQREEARALFEQMKELPPEQREKLREEWKAMTPEQRRAWVRKNAPKDPRPLPPLPPR
ncbi:MAG: DUF3106 domain-containing protein [Pseudoxanthomonas sp.]